IRDVIRVLAEDSKVNIIATPKAGEKEVTIFLQNVTLEETIKAICRISHLWYRHDKDAQGTYRLMTTEEYSQDLVIGQDDAIKVFQLHNPNVRAIASAIENLYADRVEVSFDGGNQSGNSGSGGGRRNNSNRFGGRQSQRGSSRNNGNRSGGGNQAQAQQIPDDLSIEKLANLVKDSNLVRAEVLAAVSGISKLIYVTINTEHNLLIVKTSDPAVLKSIASLVEQLDRRQTQVMLEMKIVDIKVGEDFSALFNFELTNLGVTGSSTNPIVLGGAAMSGGGTLVYEYVSKHIKANIELLEQNNRVNVIANPMIVASNHRPAKLFVGEERIMVRGYSVDTIDSLNSSRTITTPETELLDIGTTLEVTPHINSDNTIHIILKQEHGTLNESAAFIPITNNNGDVVNLPVDTVTTAKLEGEIFARHGYTVAVGGLIRDSFSRSRRKVPFLADIPYIGNIFRSTVDEDSKSEMVLLITPYILNQGKEEAQFDPTGKYNKYAPNQSLHAKPIIENKSKTSIACGEYCAPANLRNSDL
ncbi:MAG: general secretion pathway protein GspD, partial [Methyloprofundus sp.]|nr:general secretion pathway protein GspD [Methyloprofundus sp.]